MTTPAGVGGMMGDEGGQMLDRVGMSLRACCLLWGGGGGGGGGRKCAVQSATCYAHQHGCCPLILTQRVNTTFSEYRVLSMAWLVCPMGTGLL